MIQRVFFCKRADHDLAGTGQLRFAIERDFSRHIRLADQQGIHILHTVCRYTVDCNDKLTGLCLDTRFGQRRTKFLAPGCPRQDLFQTEEATFITRYLCPQQTGFHPFGAFRFARIHISVATAKLADHLTDDIVQIQTGLCIGKQYGIFSLDSFPVHTMHIFEIEAIPVSTPCFIEYLCPFLRIIDCDFHIRQVDGFTQVCLTGRNIRHIKRTVLKENSLFATRLHTHRSAVGNNFFFLFFQVKDFRSATASVINFVAIRIEISIIGRIHRKFYDTVRDTVKIDLDCRSGGFFFLWLILFLRCFFFLNSHLGILFHKRRRRIFRQQRKIDTIHVIIDMIPFQRSVCRIEIAC